MFRIFKTHVLSSSRQNSVANIQKQLLRIKDELRPSAKRNMRIVDGAAKRRKFTPRHQWDGVPKDYHLIFESNVKDWIGGFRIGVTCMAAISLGMAASGDRVQKATFDEKMVIGAALCIVLTIVTVTNIGCRQFFKRIYCHPRKPEFIAVRRTCFGRNERLYYKQEDIVFNPKPGEEFQDGTVVKVNGRKLHLGAADFISPSFYNIHLGSHHETYEKTQVGGPTSFY